MTRLFVFFNSALAALLLLGGCQTVRSPKQKGVTHIVVFWLKRHGNEADRQTLIDASQKLKAISGAQSVAIGPVLPSKRAEVDASCDLALVMQFPNEQALRDYERNPIHQNAVKQVLKPLVSRFVVYDFANR